MSDDIEHEPWRSTEYGNLALVRAVKERPCLYNNTIPEYSNKDKTAAAWQEIADEFGCSAEKCKKRWKCLRISYFKNKNQQLYSNKKAPYYLDKHMSFLLPFTHSRLLINKLKEISKNRKEFSSPANTASENVDKDKRNNDATEIAMAVASLGNSDNGTYYVDCGNLELEDGVSEVQIMTEEEYQNSVSNSDHTIIQIVDASTSDLSIQSSQTLPKSPKSPPVKTLLNFNAVDFGKASKYLSFGSSKDAPQTPAECPTEVQSVTEIQKAISSINSSRSPSKSASLNDVVPVSNIHPTALSDTENQYVDSLNITDVGSDSQPHSIDGISEVFQTPSGSLQTLNKIQNITSGSLRKQFLISVLPEINEMTENQFRVFKRKVLSVIDEVTDIMI